MELLLAPEEMTKNVKSFNFIIWNGKNRIELNQR